jgi:hypothetical protein
MCEGWSLDIGNALRGSVVRQHQVDQPTTWRASMNAASLGEYPDRKSAMARVEADIVQQMKMVLHDWELYQARKDRR